MLRLEPPVPQNMTFFVSRVFTEVVRPSGMAALETKWVERFSSKWGGFLLSGDYLNIQEGI